MRRVMESLYVFLIGAFGYSILEILWRGYTHWTMAITGGICFLSVYFVFAFMSDYNIFIKCGISAVVITAVEFSAGSIVNLWLKWNIWDYSSLRFNILGQVCALYSALWFLLCIPLSFLCAFLQRFFAIYR